MRRHRELDAISISDFVTVFEIKATRSEMADLRGTGQLRKSGTILRSGTLGRSRGVALVLIWVVTASGPVEVAGWLPVKTPDRLRISVDAQKEHPYLLRISARHAWAWRRALGIMVEESLWEEHQTEAAILRETHATTTDWPGRDDTAPENSTMAAALRQALKGPER